MSFFKSIFYGVKLYFLASLAIGLSYFIEIQRNDLNGNIEDSMLNIIHSIEILTLVFPLFCFYVGSKQSNLIRRKTDSGFAAAISASIGFLMILYMNWIIALGSLMIADAVNILDNINNWYFDSEINNINEILNEQIWRIIPAILAGLFAAIINNKNEDSKQLELKNSLQNDVKESSPTPWLYSVGVIDEHGFEWIKHNNKQWYRNANSGDEWKEYS
tara:strand:+ start:1133 stop:1783 length:651 start_codon:yes stop_codon:yes gene_type:complete